MSTEKHDPWALLREARESVVRDIPSFGWETDEVAAQQDRLELLSRIDAALARHDSDMEQHRRDFARDVKDLDRTLAAWKQQGTP